MCNWNLDENAAWAAWGQEYAALDASVLLQLHNCDRATLPKRAPKVQVQSPNPLASNMAVTQQKDGRVVPDFRTNCPAHHHCILLPEYARVMSEKVPE